MPEVFVIATPIGNLEDVSTRAREILATVDILAAEDTRVAGKLLSLLNIPKKELVSYHDHNEERQAEVLINRIQTENLRLGVVSDAGTPCVADPGFRLVRAAHKAGIAVHPIPGPSASIALVSASGLPSNRILFEGFLPAKAHGLELQVQSWRGIGASVVFFESTRRIGKTVEAIAKEFPMALFAVGREMTKLYEEIVQLNAADVAAWASGHGSMKGELTVMVDLGEKRESFDLDSLKADALAGYAAGKSFKDLMIELRDRGLKRNELYQLLLELKEDFES
jgi:16S rRNA (cytidine1402-2'-O)-methyltransferase